jgi:hypothetical protein
MRSLAGLVWQIAKNELLISAMLVPGAEPFYRASCCGTAAPEVRNRVVRRKAGFWRDSTLQFAGHDLVDIAPHPCFTWFDGTDQRVFRFVEVFRGVLVLGGIATSYVPARQTEP